MSEQLLQQAEENYAEHKKAGLDKEASDNYAEGIRETYQALRLLASAYGRFVDNDNNGTINGVILPSVARLPELGDNFDEYGVPSTLSKINEVGRELHELGYDKLLDEEIDASVAEFRGIESFQDVSVGVYNKALTPDAQQKYDDALDKSELHYLRNKDAYAEAAREIAESEGVEIR